MSERGREYVNEFWEALTKALGIKRSFSTAYHPQTDGQTERLNQTLEQYLRLYVGYQQDDWTDHLPLAEFAYNNAEHKCTGVAPFFANKGYHPRLEIRGSLEAGSAEYQEYAADLRLFHDCLRQEARRAQAEYAAIK